MENAAVREIYPTYHVMFRNVSEETAENLLEDERFTDAGLREDMAYVVTKVRTSGAAWWRQTRQCAD